MKNTFFLRSLIGTIIMGILYGVLTYSIPYITADAIFLLLMMGLLFFLSTWTILKSGLKSRGAMFAQMLVFGLVTYISGWATFYQMSGRGFALAHPGDFLSFIVSFPTGQEFTVSRSLTAVNPGNGLANAAYFFELILLLIPAFGVFKKVRQQELR